MSSQCPRPASTNADHLSNYTNTIKRTRSLLNDLKYQHGRAADQRDRRTQPHHFQPRRPPYRLVQPCRPLDRRSRPLHRPRPHFQRYSLLPPGLPTLHQQRPPTYGRSQTCFLIADHPRPPHQTARHHRRARCPQNTRRTYLPPTADTVETHTRTHQRLTRTDHLHTRHDLQAKYPEWLREAGPTRCNR